MSMQLDFLGVEEFFKALDTLEKDIKELEEEALVRGGEVIRGEIDKNLNNTMVQERTGGLRGSIGLSSTHVKSGEKYIKIGVVGDKTYKGKYRQLIKTASGVRRNKNATGNANYAYFVEFGTSRAPAYPFMRSAYDSKQQQARSVMVQVIKGGIRRGNH